MRPQCYTTFAIFFALVGAQPACANDSEAETAVGGLTLVKSDSISMDSEDLFISRDLVRVKYRFTNKSDAPIETLVAFPLPDIPPTDAENTSYWSEKGGIKFKTKIDGKPIDFETVEQAIFKDKDVSARLTALKLPLNRLAKDFEDALKKVPKAEVAKLVADGLMENTGSEEYPNWVANWSLRTTITRHQTFPANATVTVEHEYKPLAGGSVGGNLDAWRRKDKELEKEFNQTLSRYCIDKEWLASFDRIEKTKRTDMGAYSEVWLGYVLKTGANWKGPIGDFRLVVDKGKADSLVSFCMDGVKKISPTRFEVRRKNFTPDRDLDILIIDWWNRK
ncbi:DUF4424 domain-containing protein [Methylocystis sp. ATCC 49242]|uniref:DUF4424 domain-containing protein n=1 Tax=Methylocystis sp. ATCC 49242 TaxID=622637 RepID=UPI0001F879D6|nr:DUF4424 domain-containing protein [Methylocystis sp. ATCC 49242]